MDATEELVKELYPKIKKSDLKKITKSYSGVIKDIVKEFLSHQMDHLDKLESFEDQKCSHCSKTKKETWVMDIQGKTICNDCVILALFKMRDILRSDTFEGAEGNTEDLKNFKDNNGDCCPCGDPDCNGGKIAELLKNVKDHPGVELSFHEDKYWANIEHLVQLFLSDSVPKGADIELASEMFQRMLITFKENLAKKK